MKENKQLVEYFLYLSQNDYIDDTDHIYIVKYELIKEKSLELLRVATCSTYCKEYKYESFPDWDMMLRGEFLEEMKTHPP